MAARPFRTGRCPARARPTLAILALTILAACTGSTERSAAQQPITPTAARRTGWLGNWLKETSGLAVSRAYPGVLWSHNDSGGDAVLFATDTSGADRGRFTIMSVENWDWEDLALGPCPQGTCLYIAETGDNAENNRSAAIYRISEPDPAGPGLARGVERLAFRYPDHPRDVEAIFVAPDSSVHLVSKGIRSEIAHYRLPASAWRAEAADQILPGMLIQLVWIGLTWSLAQVLWKVGGKRYVAVGG